MHVLAYTYLCNTLGIFFFTNPVTFLLRNVLNVCKLPFMSYINGIPGKHQPCLYIKGVLGITKELSKNLKYF